MKKLSDILKVLLLGIVLAGGISYAWVSPVGTPPANNVSAPINVSSSTQNKLGALGLNILSIFQQGQVSTSSYILPTSLLFGVNGNIGAKQFCDQNGLNCSTPPFSAGGASCVQPPTTSTSTSGSGGGPGNSWGMNLANNLPAGTYRFLAQGTCSGAQEQGGPYCAVTYTDPYNVSTSLLYRGYSTTAGPAGWPATELEAHKSDASYSANNGNLWVVVKNFTTTAPGAKIDFSQWATWASASSTLIYTPPQVCGTGSSGTTTVISLDNMKAFTSGSGTWTVPAGVTAIRATIVGGGGGGGIVSCGGGLSGGGGGGGAGILAYMKVTPGQTLSYSVGVGGLSSSVGGNTTFNGLVAGGGTGGSGGGGGAGGTVSTSQSPAVGTLAGTPLYVPGNGGSGAPAYYSIGGSAGLMGSGAAGGNAGPSFGGGGSGGCGSAYSGSGGLVMIEYGSGSASGTTSSSSGVSTVVRLATSSTSWVVPDGVISVKATIVGDGGGGGGGQSGDSWGSTGYGGGAGATAIVYIKNLTPGQTLSYSIGNGGARSCEGYGCNGGNGSGTTFDGIFVGGGIGGHGGANGYLASTGGTVSLSQSATVGSVSFWGGYVGNSAPASSGGSYGAGGIGADGYLPNLIPVVSGETAPATASGSYVSGPGAGGNGMGAGGGGGGRRGYYGGSAGGKGAPGGIILEY